MNDMTQPQLPETLKTGRPDSASEANANSALALANSFAVTDPDTAQMAADELKLIVDKKNELEEKRTAITKPINEGLRAINALFKKPLDLLEQAEGIFKRKLIAYTEAEERKRREAQAAAEELARKESERLKKEADKLAAKGHVEKAEAKRELAASIPQPVYVPPAATTGFTKSKNWKARPKGATWKRDLILFVAANPTFDHLLDLNEANANREAKNREKADLGIPGLEGFNDSVGRVR